MESIDALAKAVNEFEGGMVLVSHDMRLISQVAKEIWICDHKTVTRYKGDIQNFKMDMRAQMGIDDKKQQLRGDASVVKKEQDAVKPKPKPVKKTIEVVPPPRKMDEVVKRTIEVVPSPRKTEEEDDAATTATSTTTSSFNSDPMHRSLADAAPDRKAYVPPHLRKKMLS